MLLLFALYCLEIISVCGCTYSSILQSGNVVGAFSESLLICVCVCVCMCVCVCLRSLGSDLFFLASV